MTVSEFMLPLEPIQIFSNELCMQFPEVPGVSLFLLLLKPVIKLTRTLIKIREGKILKMTH